MRNLFFLKNFTEFYISEFLQPGGAMFLFLTTSRISVGFKDCDVIAQNSKVIAKAVGFRRSSTWVPLKRK